MRPADSQSGSQDESIVRLPVPLGPGIHIPMTRLLAGSHVAQYDGIAGSRSRPCYLGSIPRFEEAARRQVTDQVTLSTPAALVRSLIL